MIPEIRNRKFPRSGGSKTYRKDKIYKKDVWERKMDPSSFGSLNCRKNQGEVGEKTHQEKTTAWHHSFAKKETRLSGATLQRQFSQWASDRENAEEDPG